MKLPQSFYLRDDVVEVSRELLGNVLCTRIDGELTKAMIMETEAYAGVDDKASHAYGGRRTIRTEPMFGPGGAAYVYLCYGIHHLFNVVTSTAGTPHAILVRAGKPVHGVDTMLQRRGRKSVDPTFMAGPGSTAQALGITTRLTGASLLDGQIWIEAGDHEVDADAVIVSSRVGVDYAAEDAARPYRFRLDPAGLA